MNYLYTNGIKRGDESKVIKMLDLDEAEKNYIKEQFRNNVEQYYITLSPQMKIKLSLQRIKDYLFIY